MAIDCEFFPIPVGNGHYLRDDLHKLVLRTGRWTPESSAQGGEIVMTLSYDPEIEVGRYTMPPSEADIRFNEQLNRPPPGEVVFESSKNRQLCQLHVDIDKKAGEVALICRGVVNNPTLRYDVRLVEMANIEGISDNPWDVIWGMMTSIPRLPYWHNEFARAWNCRKVCFYLDRRLAVEISEHVGFCIPENDEEFVVLSCVETTRKP